MWLPLWLSAVPIYSVRQAGLAPATRLEGRRVWERTEVPPQRDSTKYFRRVVTLLSSSSYSDILLPRIAYGPLQPQRTLFHSRRMFHAPIHSIKLFNMGAYWHTKQLLSHIYYSHCRHQLNRRLSLVGETVTRVIPSAPVTNRMLLSLLYVACKILPESKRLKKGLKNDLTLRPHTFLSYCIR